jgi:hypothetical protein
MSLLKLLQEASSLGIDGLKKAMLKDKNAKLIFSTDLTLDKIEDKEAFLATMKYWLLNNENVRQFIASRHNVRDLDKQSLSAYRQMRGKDLDEDKLEWLQQFVKNIFKEHGAVEKGTMSADLKKKLRDWMDTSGGYYALPTWATNELMSIPSLRPTKRILVYRGLLFSEYSLKEREKYDGTLEVGNGLAFLRSVKKGTREVDLTWDRPSSWSASKDVAERFAKYGPASSSYSATLQWLERSMQKKHIDGALGFVISTFANPEDILIDTRLSGALGTKHSDEAEVILKPGTYKARIVKKFTVEGEVDPEKTDDSSSAVTELFNRVDEFISKFQLPEDEASLSLEKRTLYTDADALLKNPSVFKKLILNSTTTSIMHAYDQLLDFYKAHLKDTGELLNPENFADNPELGRRASALEEFKKFFEYSVKHSKFASKKGQKHELDAAEYRATLSDYDLTYIENDLMRHGRISSDSSRAFERLAANLGVDTPKSARFSMFGVAKQEPIINEVIDSFFKLIDVERPADNTEAKKMMINFRRKAFRNIVLLDEIRKIKKLLETKND